MNRVAKNSFMYLLKFVASSNLFGVANGFTVDFLTFFPDFVNTNSST